jgi:AbrB family looped-hinge helix DNA binding protein
LFYKFVNKEFLHIKLTDVVIPKEIRRTMRIREGDPLDNSLTLEEKFAIAVHSVVKRYTAQ